MCYLSIPSVVFFFYSNLSRLRQILMANCLSSEIHSFHFRLGCSTTGVSWEGVETYQMGPMENKLLLTSRPLHSCFSCLALPFPIPHSITGQLLLALWVLASVLPPLGNLP